MNFNFIIKNSLVIVALGLTLTLSSCENNSKSKEIKEITPSSTLGAEPSDASVSNPVKVKTSQFQVAPIFAHGKGLSAYDSKSVVTPYYFTKKEAFQIISEEAKCYGNITLITEDTPTWNDVKLPVTDLREEKKKKKAKKVKELGNLKTTGWDEDNSIVIKFISKNDMEKWADHGKDATRKEYAFMDTAQRLQTELSKKKANYIYGIFYDPCSTTQTSIQFNRLKEVYLDEGRLNWDVFFDELMYNQKVVYEESLRLQVRSFIDWMKDEGIKVS